MSRLSTLWIAAICLSTCLLLVEAARHVDVGCGCDTTATRRVLLQLYDTTSGDDWNNNTGWLSNMSLCSWYGVECSSTAVISLHLGDNNLTGNLPDSLGNLTSLQFLDLSFNQLAGSLPSSWLALSQLETLLLSFNTIAGTLPAAWSSLTALTYLDLSYNQIALALPVSWGRSLIKLQHLDLFNNVLTGSLPQSWSGMAAMQQLDLSNNNFDGGLPTSWASMKALEQLDLSSNQLSGPFSVSWYNNFPLLQGLFLSDNMLRGEFNACENPGWTSLVLQGNLQLQRNDLSGPFNFSCFQNVTAECGALKSNLLTGNSFCGSYCELPSCSSKPFRLI